MRFTARPPAPRTAHHCWAAVVPCGTLRCWSAVQGRALPSSGHCARTVQAPVFCVRAEHWSPAICVLGAPYGSCPPRRLGMPSSSDAVCVVLVPRHVALLSLSTVNASGAGHHTWSNLSRSDAITVRRMSVAALSCRLPAFVAAIPADHPRVRQDASSFSGLVLPLQDAPWGVLFLTPAHGIRSGCQPTGN